MLVPQTEALELPGKVERANAQSLTRKYAIRPHPTLSRRIRTEYTYPLGHLLFAAFLTLPLKFSRFPFVKKERRVNAFHMSWQAERQADNSQSPPTLPMTGLCDSVCVGKANNKVPIPQHLAHDPLHQTKDVKLTQLQNSRTMSVIGIVRVLSSRQKQKE